MAPSKQRLNFNRRENNEEGHDIKWDLSISNLQTLCSWPFEKTYRTRCEAAPTVWKLRIWVPEMRDDGTCSLSVALKRVDSANLALEAVIWIDICDSNEYLIFPRQMFDKPGMLPGDSFQERVEIAPRPGMGDAVDENVILFVTLMICFCHSDSD